MSKKCIKVGPVMGRNGKQIGTRMRNTDTGKEFILLNPHGKYAKATVELERGVRLTNDGKIKRDKDGKPIKLSNGQRLFRAGYRSAVIDQTKAFNGSDQGGLI